jgi:hypothetical protein
MKRPTLAFVFLTAALGFSGCCCPEPNGPGGFNFDGIISLSPRCTPDGCNEQARLRCASHLGSGVCSGTRCGYTCVTS